MRERRSQDDRKALPRAANSGGQRRRRFTADSSGSAGRRPPSTGISSSAGGSGAHSFASIDVLGPPVAGVAVQRELPIQRTVWEWKYPGGWHEVYTKGSSTKAPDTDGTYFGERRSTGGEKPWEIPKPEEEGAEEEGGRDQAWKSETRKPLYMTAFGETITPGSSGHSEEQLIRLLKQQVSNMKKAEKQKWAARATKAQTSGLDLTLNAFPCLGGGDPQCHLKLKELSKDNQMTVRVTIVGNSGGYESDHHSQTGWVDGATKITYTNGAVAYGK